MAAEAQNSFDHDRQDKKPYPEEYRLTDRQLGASDIAERQGHHADHARQDKQPASDNAADHAMHQPSDIYGKLLGFRPRQRNAITKSVKEAVFGNPTLLLDQKSVHGRKLQASSANAGG